MATNSWEGVTDAVADRYKSAYTYDANGNILTAERHDETGQQYDDFAYQYHDPGGLLAQNRLYDLYDAATHTTGADIVAPAGTFDNSSTGVNQYNNYKYDELGNLVHDKREEIESIEWTVSGKVKRITRTAGSTKPPLEFAYGADGQRISKQVGEPANGGYKEHYIRDASGNIMATYRYLLNPVPNTNPPEYESSLKLTERPIYGSSRLGSHTRQMEMVGSTPPQYYPYIQPMHAPLKRYELTDHLGNVSTVITGKLLPGNGAGSAYQADVVSAQGYEAFGSLLPGRNYSSDAYRFGFQGQEKDDEIYGSTGTSYTAEFWQYDPRTGRRWNLDPKPLPFASNYSVFRNSPIWFSDAKGDSSVWDTKGYMLHYDPNDKDLRAFMRDGDNYTLMGSLGGDIDASGWFPNLLRENSQEADGIWNPFTFRDNVRQDGKWDYKYRSAANEDPVNSQLPHHILGVAFYRQDKARGAGDLAETQFLFNRQQGRAQDLNNLHFGVVGKALGLFSEGMMLHQAGKAEMGKWASEGKQVPVEWRPMIEVSHKDEFGVWIKDYRLGAPYGDNPVDHDWIKRGFRYYNANRANLDGD